MTKKRLKAAKAALETGNIEEIDELLDEAIAACDEGYTVITDDSEESETKNLDE